MHKLLLVEDNEGLREQMKWALADDYEVLESDSLDSTVNACNKHHPEVICLDMGLENDPERGLSIIDAVILLNRHIKIIVITSNTNQTLGSRAVERGAFDFLQKPVDIDELKVLLSRAARISQLEVPIEQLHEGGLPSYEDNLIIGQSSKMKSIFTTIKRISKTDVNVLITGESGTGKELCARAIHFHSNRRNKVFMPINCGAIPESLMESELFGYMKGAFTGANSNKTGLIESSHNGTLFLDEIGDMPKHLQVKLLRFLEDQKIQRLGDTRFISLNVRVIAATNKEDVFHNQGETMRNDLYYRLSEFEIYLPPLSDREDDIILLAQNFITRNRVKFNVPKLRLSPRANKALMSYSWPGNVRELENKLNRASITCRQQVIEPDDLQLSETSFKNITFKEARQLFEKNFIINALKQAGGNITLAAKTAGITRPTFYDLMKKKNIQLHMQAKIEEGD